VADGRLYFMQFGWGKNNLDLLPNLAAMKKEIGVEFRERRIAGGAQGYLRSAVSDVVGRHREALGTLGNAWQHGKSLQREYFLTLTLALLFERGRDSGLSAPLVRTPKTQDLFNGRQIKMGKTAGKKSRRLRRAKVIITWEHSGPINCPAPLLSQSHVDTKRKARFHTV